MSNNTVQTNQNLEQLRKSVFETVSNVLGKDEQLRKGIEELQVKPLDSKALEKLEEYVSKAVKQLVDAKQTTEAQRLLTDFVKLRELVEKKQLQNQTQVATQGQAATFLSLNNKSAANLTRLANGFQQKYLRALENFEKVFSIDPSTQEIFRSLTSGGDHLKSFNALADNKKTQGRLDAAIGKTLSQLDALSWVCRKAIDMPGGLTAENIKKAYEQFKKENEKFFTKDKDGREVFRVTDANLKDWLDNRERLGELLGRNKTANGTIKWDQFGMVWRLNNQAKSDSKDKIAIRPHILSNAFHDHLLTSVAALQTIKSAGLSTKPAAQTDAKPQTETTTQTASTQVGSTNQPAPSTSTSQESWVAVDKQKSKELGKAMLNLSQNFGLYSPEELKVLEKISSDSFDGKLTVQEKAKLEGALRNTEAFFQQVGSSMSRTEGDMLAQLVKSSVQHIESRILTLAKDAGFLTGTTNNQNSQDINLRDVQIDPKEAVEIANILKHYASDMKSAGYGLDLGEMEAIMHVIRTNGSDTVSVLRFMISAIKKFESYARLFLEGDVQLALWSVYDSQLYKLAQKA